MNRQAGSRAIIDPRQVPGAPYSSLFLGGELDLSNVAEFARVADAATALGRPLVVEMRAVTFVDAAFLGALVNAKNAAATAGTGFRAEDPSPFVRRLIAMTGLSHLLDEAVPDERTASAV